MMSGECFHYAMALGVGLCFYQLLRIQEEEEVKTRQNCD